MEQPPHKHIVKKIAFKCIMISLTGIGVFILVVWMVQLLGYIMGRTALLTN